MYSGKIAVPPGGGGIGVIVIVRFLIKEPQHRNLHTK
jgi:hypothetical protein